MIEIIVLEGADGVGKTCVTKKLKGYHLLDRDKNVSKLFDFNFSLVDRVNFLIDYFNECDNYMIFLIDNNMCELEKRINLRCNKDNYDKYAYLYNLLYLETYLYMEKNNLFSDRLFMIDCSGLDINEETYKVKSLIDNVIKR